MLVGRRFGSGGWRRSKGLESWSVWLSNDRLIVLEGREAVFAFSYEYNPRPERGIAGREAHVYTMGTGMFERGAASLISTSKHTI